VEAIVSKKVLIGITALVGLLCVTACGDKKKDAPAGGGTTAAKPTAGPAEGGQEVKVDAATAGVIKGKVTFANAPEKLPGPIDMGAKAAECATADKPKVDEYYVVGENNAAANVIVYVKSGPARNVKTPVPSTEVAIDQVNCMYTPRVIAMRAGQPVRFKSSDPTSHNIHLQSRLNGDWNETMQAKSSFLAGENKSQKIAAAELPVSLKCDIHTWMRAYAGVFNHDYFRVTTKDGTYELNNLPPGDYEIEAWHERAKGKAQKVTVGPKETKSLDFSLKFEE
jgi:plastocyanin